LYTLDATDGSPSAEHDIMTTDTPPLTPLELGHKAAELAASNAEYQLHGWKDRAYDAFTTMVARGLPFTTEDVRVANPDIPTPSDQRAWGQVALRAKRAGLVKSVGIAIGNVHGRYLTQWKAAA
jgi:hypothetical protein